MNKAVVLLLVLSIATAALAGYSRSYYKGHGALYHSSIGHGYHGASYYHGGYYRPVGHGYTRSYFYKPSHTGYYHGGYSHGPIGYRKHYYY